MVSHPIWLGILVVVSASVLMVVRPLTVFGRKLSLKEAIAVCWVAFSVYMAAFVAYVGLKIPLGLSQDADAPAAGIAVCASLIAVFWLARLPTDWESAVAKSLCTLFTFTIAVVGITLFITNGRH
jgi:hypothetical protein